MTREEALKVLKYRSGWNLSIRDVNALDMAIKALEQQPCYNPDEWCHDCREYDHDKHCCPRYNNVIRNAVEEMKQPCEDAISRKYAIDAVANLFEMSEYPHPYSQGKPIRLKDIKEKLKHLPPVQPKKIECVDAISQEDALDALHMCLSTNSYDDDVTGDSYICYEEAEYEIEKLPSVQPKPKTGHWIDDEFGSKCSCCGIHTHLDKFDKPMKFKYCSMCGAKMIDLPDINDGKMSEIPTGSDSQESKKINCKSAKCENCINHNYCDYEPQESEG